jgi:putative colanic acid biosynthesis acetyltransferase WcaF
MRDLSSFDASAYDRGRSKIWQVLWFSFSFLVFQKFWFPNRFRSSALRLFGATIGERVFIRHDVRIMWPWKLEVGDDCWLGEGSRFINLEKISISNNVCISQEVMLCTGSHDHRRSDFPYRNRPITILDGAWIAARATVLPGVTVGPQSVVAAGEIARKDIPANKLLLDGTLCDIPEPA